MIIHCSWDLVHNVSRWISLWWILRRLWELGGDNSHREWNPQRTRSRFRRPPVEERQRDNKLWRTTGGSIYIYIEMATSAVVCTAGLDLVFKIHVSWDWPHCGVEKTWCVPITSTKDATSHHRHHIVSRNSQHRGLVACAVDLLSGSGAANDLRTFCGVHRAAQETQVQTHRYVMQTCMYRDKYHWGEVVIGLCFVFVCVSCVCGCLKTNSFLSWWPSSHRQTEPTRSLQMDSQRNAQRIRISWSHPRRLRVSHWFLWSARSVLHFVKSRPALRFKADVSVCGLLRHPVLYSWEICASRESRRRGWLWIYLFDRSRTSSIRQIWMESHW